MGIGSSKSPSSNAELSCTFMELIVAASESTAPPLYDRLEYDNLINAEDETGEIGDEGDVGGEEDALANALALRRERLGTSN